MNKISACILVSILTFSLVACASVVSFDGSRTGNESQLIMEYKILNTTDIQMLELTAGDIVNFDVVSESGRVDISLQKGGEYIYKGADIPTSSFQVEIADSGKYRLSVTGDRAKGSVSVTKANSDTENTDLPNKTESSDNRLIDNSFISLTITDNETISSEFEIDLTGNEATFLTVEVTEDTEAVVHYTYTTKEKSGAVWGYYPNGSDDKVSFELRAGTENAYNAFWTDETIALKQGMNLFYVSGNDVSCKMYFEISKIDKNKVSYVGAYTKEEAIRQK